MRLGLLSTARINAAIVTGAAAVDGVDVVTVGSRDAARARAHADELGVPRAVGSYEAVLEDPDVDAVYVSLPNGLHVDWAIRALAAGKHVLCEKPLTRRPDDARRAFDAAERAGRVLSEAFMWRHHPQAATLVASLPRVGTLRSVRAAFAFGLDRPEDPRWDPALDGGALMDVGCYCVSGLRLVAGEPEQVVAQQVEHPDHPGVDVRMAGAMRFAGDVLGSFECAFDTAPRAGLEVVGDQGRLALSDPWHGRHGGVDVVAADGATDRVEVEQADPYAEQLRDFAAAAADGRPPRLGPDDALGQARVIAALYESAASGEAVDL